MSDGDAAFKYAFKRLSGDVDDLALRGA